MARQLVESLAVDEFMPEKFRDEYREQVLDLIEKKAAGEAIVAEPEVEAPAKVLDLVAALEASLAKADTAKDRHPSGTGAAEPAPAKKAAKKATKQPAKKTAKKAAAKRKSA
jgi:DNA end-binding protein Ku